MNYKIEFDKNAILDINDAVEYYQSISLNVKVKFYLSLQKSFKELNRNPYFQIRYDDVRCLPLNKFPYMIHFRIYEEIKTVKVFSVLNTYRDPKKYYIK